MSVFWVDPRYRLRGRKRFSLQGSPGVTDTRPVLVPVIHVTDYLAVGPDSAPGVWAIGRVCTGPT